VSALPAQGTIVIYHGNSGDLPAVVYGTAAAWSSWSSWDVPLAGTIHLAPLGAGGGGNPINIPEGTIAGTYSLIP
jgi:hypothetical protein